MKSPLLIAFAVALCACQPHPPSATLALDQAAQDAQLSNPEARTLALAGFHAFLVEGKAAEAEARFDAAVQKSPAEPYALIGQMLMARRRGHPERALTAALDLCERAPQHPLSAVAARVVLDAAGTAVPLDELILQRAPKALAAGALGDAAHLLRSAVATIQGQRSQNEAQAKTLDQMGMVRSYSLWGPFSAFRLLGFDDLLDPEKDGSLPPAPRTIRFPDGRLSLAGEPARGDMYLLAADVAVPEAGAFVVRSVTGSPSKTYLDGTLLFQGREFERPTSTVRSAGVQLSAGTHRLLVKLSRSDHAATLSVSVMRADGQPSQVTVQPAVGAAPVGTELKLLPPEGVFVTTSDMEHALIDEAGEALAIYLAARDGLGRDRDGAKALFAALPETLSSPAITALRSELDLSDRTIPSKVAHGRATRDLEATAEKDTGDVTTLLARASLAIEDSRYLEAAEFIKQARAAHTPAGFQVPLLQARVDLGLGVDAQADQSALEALRTQAGLCEALTLRYDLARRRDAVQLADQLVEQLSSCPGAQSRSAEHAKTRGNNAKAISLYEDLLSRDPSHIPTASVLSNLYVSERRYPEALRLLKDLTTLWPRNAALLKHQAEVLEASGAKDQALAVRVKALALDGTDLSLRRSVDRARTGKEPLEAYAVSAKAALEAYQEQHADEDAPSAYVLDFAAMEAHPDGSMLDRIHVIQKAIDQTGVSEIAEVNIPQGAQVLSLRTLKPDGTVLEPESIEDKDTVSLPGVQAGDFIEYEYLLTHPPRGPIEPGFTAPNFYFQVAKSPNNWSTYVVVAPKGSGMQVDAHNMTSRPPTVEGGLEVYRHDEKHVPAFIPEPSGPPSGNEYLPFVAVGGGDTGNEHLVHSYADGFLDRGQVTFEVEQFVRKAVEGKTGLEAAKALYAAVMHKLQGQDGGLAQSASFSLAQDRGSRLWALKAGLTALGIPARLAAVRTFAVDPAPYRFPNEQLLPYVCIRAELPDHSFVWLDPLIRFAPFGELPEQAAGGREALLFPEPGKPLERTRTPAQAEGPGKQVKLTLQLTADGKLSGSGVETYGGTEAAQLAEALEQLSPDQRDQALQSALSRYFGGAELSKLKLDIHREVGGTLEVRYDFVAPRFARVEGDKLVLGPLTFPAQLGRRYVQLGSRRTPLFIDGTERVHTEVNVQLPAGYQIKEPVPEIRTASAFGSFLRHERQENGHLLVDEEFRLNMVRVPPKLYEQFGQFAGEVDLVQTRDLLAEKR